MAIDLDKARAARREARGEGPIVIFNGISHELPVEMPIEVLEAMRGLASEATAAGALMDCTRVMLGEFYDEFMETKPSVDDLMELVDGLMGEYGVESPLQSSAP